MIVSFGDARTEDVYHGTPSARARSFPADVLKAARRKLDMLNAVTRPDDLKTPPGNRLEALAGDWSGFYSIRVNDQWRIVFRWDNGAHGVRLIDYH